MATLSDAVAWALVALPGEYLIRYADSEFTDAEDPGSRCGYGDEELDAIRAALRSRGLALGSDDLGLLATQDAALAAWEREHALNEAARRAAMIVPRYAVVQSPGCHGSGERVRPISMHVDLAKALAAAKKATREYQRAMRPHGGSSGYYRVIEAPDRVWLGWELDLYPTITAASQEVR